MSQLLLHNARVVRKDGVQPGGVLVDEGRIVRVFSLGETPAGISSRESIDLGEDLLAPGLIDIHIHGSAGTDVQETDPEGLARLSEFLLSEGVTGFFATFVPTTAQNYRDGISRIESYIAAHDRQRTGARLLGIHFEGPFVNRQKCGALQPEYFRVYDGDSRAIEVFTTPTNYPRLMTLAPEIDGGIELIRALSNRGLRVFIGHSRANPDALELGFEAGARHITHFPNALDPLHHRKPGAFGWGLMREEVTLDCIADFHHVDPTMLRLINKTKRADRLSLISDAIAPAGLGDGDFSVWGTRITVRDGAARLAEGEAAGALCGSVITLRQAVKNMVSIGLPIEQAIRMASLNPAEVAGIASDRGSIEVGKRADLVSFNDKFEVRRAWRV
jgi:N-acetylglucosamine-6-phosphate deacetylase